MKRQQHVAIPQPRLGPCHRICSQAATNYCLSNADIIYDAIQILYKYVEFSRIRLGQECFGNLTSCKSGCILDEQSQ